MAKCSWHRNGTVSFAAFFVVVSVVVIVMARLWLSWSVVASAAVRAVLATDPGEQVRLLEGYEFRHSAREFQTFRELVARAANLPYHESQRIAASRHLNDAKVIAISYIVLGAVKFALSVILLVTALTELVSLLRPWVVADVFLLAATVLQVGGTESVLLEEPPGVALATPGHMTPRGVAIVLPLVALVYIAVDVCSVLCVRKFNDDLLAQRMRPAVLVQAKFV